MPKKFSQTGPSGAERAAVIALNFISYLANDEDKLSRFCVLTGLSPNDLRDSIGSADFQAMALDYALQNEELLIDFATQENLSPQEIVAARRYLPGFVE
jgi:uncharacterized protein DUF3572